MVIGVVLAGAGPEPFAMARFHPTGAVDTGFGAASLVTTPFDTRDAVARAVAVQADDKIVVAGSAVNVRVTKQALARILP